MRQGVIFMLTLVATALTGLGAFRLLRAPAASDPKLASLIPPGALLEIEAKDFSSLLSDWNNSREKEQWLASDNYQTFSRSRLFLRLDQSRQEFESAAGFPSDMSFLKDAAGSESALALYDIGKIEFLYVTRMPLAKTAGSALWQKRGDFQTRSVGNQPYYVRVDPASQRTVAFAATPDLLLLATREDLMTGALKLAASADSGAQLSIESEHWFDQATRAANQRGPQGDLRLVLNLTALARSPYFRSYWIQRNVSDIRAFDSAVCDLYRSASEIREERILFRHGEDGENQAVPAEQLAGTSAIGTLLAMLPSDTGFYRGWAHPSPAETVRVVSETVLSPQPSARLPGNQAPVVALNGGEAGGAGDFETRIDQAPPPSTEGTLAAGPLQAFFERMQPEAILEVDSSRRGNSSVLPESGRAVLLAAPGHWDPGDTRKTIQSAVESLWTTSRLGIQWTQKSENGVSFDALDGLASIDAATHGNVLIVADDPDLMLEILRQTLLPSKLKPADYVAGLRLDLERQPFETITRFIDWSSSRPGVPHQPSFFSDNLGSLVRTADRIESATIVAYDEGNRVRQTVVYSKAQPFR
jgi:hypothetical protein